MSASSIGAALAAAMAEFLGSDAAAGYRIGPWGFSDAQHLQDELSAAGFVDVEVSRDEMTVVFEDADHLIRTLGNNTTNTPPTPFGTVSRAMVRYGTSARQWQ